GLSAVAQVEQAMKKRNLQIVAIGKVDGNSVDVAEAVKAIAKPHLQVVVMITAYKPGAAFIKAMYKAGHYPKFMNLSFVGSKALARELGDEARGVGIAQVVPFPWSQGAPVVNEYQKLLT